VRHTNTASLAAEIGPKGIHPPLRPVPTIETQFVQEPLLPATELSRITDQEARDLLADCLSASRAALAASHCGGRIDADDLAQELWLRFAHRPDNERHWGALKLSASRLIIDELRRDERREPLDELRADPQARDPAEMLGRREAATMLIAKFTPVLTPTEYAVLVLFMKSEAVEGRRGAYELIARVLKMTPGAVALHIHRIRRKARRRFLAEYEALYAS
jgi:DNA-directed RNA polymerase specialized sigma24 family protein